MLVDKSSAITGVSVFRGAEAKPFQILPACKWASDFGMTLTEYDGERELLRHADFNFDGYEDVELLQEYVPHLGESIWCIYTWDQKAKRFQYAPEVPTLDPVPHPVNKTITVHQEWQGGLYKDSTYRWNHGKAELIEESGVLGGSDNPKCGFTRFCSRLINGRMATTATKPFVCEDQPEEEDRAELICPVAPERPSTTR